VSPTSAAGQQQREATLLNGPLQPSWVRLGSGTEPTDDDLVDGHALVQFSEKDYVNGEQIRVSLLPESVDVSGATNACAWDGSAAYIGKSTVR